MTLPSGTVTLLFTDVEGSTRRWQDDPEAMRALLTEHDAILRWAIEKHHGQLFKHTGDGGAAVFASASDAVAAFPGDLDSIEARVAAMTFDDLADYALDALGSPAEHNPHEGTITSDAAPGHDDE